MSQRLVATQGYNALLLSDCAICGQEVDRDENCAAPDNCPHRYHVSCLTRFAMRLIGVNTTSRFSSPCRVCEVAVNQYVDEWWNELTADADSASNFDSSSDDSNNVQVAQPNNIPVAQPNNGPVAQLENAAPPSPTLSEILDVEEFNVAQQAVIASTTGYTFHTSTEDMPDSRCIDCNRWIRAGQTYRTFPQCNHVIHHRCINTWSQYTWSHQEDYDRIVSFSFDCNCRIIVDGYAGYYRNERDWHGEPEPPRAPLTPLQRRTQRRQRRAQVYRTMHEDRMAGTWNPRTDRDVSDNWFCEICHTRVGLFNMRDHRNEFHPSQSRHLYGDN